MAFNLVYSEEKNQILKATRGIGFEEVISCIASDKLLDDKHHPDPGKSHQHIFIIQIDKYAYVVPYVVDVNKKEIFLKTVYPSRKYTKQYFKKGDL
ncbi:MAG: toxin [Patescibacteria group bacterium]|jgi:hypothetical protein|nr:toxin [Patescibacteria group bacterium]